MLGYFTCYGTIHIQSSGSWRLPMALQSGIAVVLALASSLQLPESPRWLTYKGRHAEATAAWNTLGVSGAEREKDSLLVANPAGQAGSATQMPETTDLRQRFSRNLKRLTGVFGKSSRKQMLLACFMMSMQQLSGIDGVLYVRVYVLEITHLVKSKQLLPETALTVGL